MLRDKFLQEKTHKIVLNSIYSIFDYLQVAIASNDRAQLRSTLQAFQYV